jgi:DNA-binding HxlR family transcriptional regulator
MDVERHNRVHLRAVPEAQQISKVIDLFKGKWTVQILCMMQDHPVRLSELKRAIPSASKKALSANLRALETLQLIVRQDLSERVLHVEYDLAPCMREPLVALLRSIAEWGARQDGH